MGYGRWAYYIGRRGRCSLVDSSPCAAVDFGVCWCVCVRVWDGGQRDAEELVELVVISGAFINFFPCNHIINIKKKFLFPAKQKTA